MLDDYEPRWKEEGLDEKLHMERFQPVIGGDGSGEGDGGTITFLKSDTEAKSDGSKSILDAGEEAGLELDYGCRMGICHTCVGKLCSGQATRHAQRRGPRRGGPDGADLHQRPRGPGGDRTLNATQEEKQ